MVTVLTKLSSVSPAQHIYSEKSVCNQNNANDFAAGVGKGFKPKNGKHGRARSKIKNGHQKHSIICRATLEGWLFVFVHGGDTEAAVNSSKIGKGFRVPILILLNHKIYWQRK